MLEYISGGDLHSKVAEGPFSEAKARSVVKDVLSALAHVHKRGVFHRDVKAKNIMLADAGHAVLVDFGLAALCQSQTIHCRCGTPGYAAPEVVRGEMCGAEADIFSLGVVLYFILSAKLPFHSNNLACILRKTVKCKPKLDGAHFDCVSNGCIRFVQATMNKHAENRPSAMEALTSSWVTGLSDHQALLQPMLSPNGAEPGLVRRYRQEARAASVCLEKNMATEGPHHVQGQFCGHNARSSSDVFYERQAALGARIASMKGESSPMSSREQILKLEGLNPQGKPTRGRFVTPWRRASTECQPVAMDEGQLKTIPQTPAPPRMPPPRSMRPRRHSLMKKLQLLVA